MNASDKISEYIQIKQDWKGELTRQIRKLILETEPEIKEDWKWNSPVWSHNGMVCSAGVFKNHVSLTFFKGAELEKITNVFNSSSDSKNTRSIIWKKNDEFNRDSIKEILLIAIKLNT